MRLLKVKSIRKCLVILLLCVLVLIGYLDINDKTNISFAKIVSKVTITDVEAKSITYKEKSLSELKDSVFLTLLDGSFNVISTTNPDKEIADNYKWTETSYPRKMVKIDSKLYLLIEMPLSKEQITKKVKEDVYYYIDLPSYLSFSDDIILDNDEEKKFYQQGKTKAYGGIYEDGPTGARFKIRFEDIKNKKEVTASYQMELKLKKKIEDQVTDLKSLNFGDLGVLQFFYEKENPQPVTPPVEKPIYVLDNNFESTNSAYTFVNNIIIRDQRESDELELKGLIRLNLSSGLGFELDTGDNFFNNLKIYADGIELTSSKSDKYQNSYYYQGKRAIDVSLLTAITDIAYDIYGVRDGYSCTNSNSDITMPSCLLSGLLFDIGGYYNESLKNVQELKIVLKEKIYTKNIKSFTSTAEFIDNTETNAYLKKDSMFTRYPYPTGFCFPMEIQKLNEYDSTPSELVEKFAVYSSPTNYIEFNVAPETTDEYGSSKLHYYLNSRAFNVSGSGTSEELDKTLSVYINNQKINFVSDDYYIYSSINDSSSTKNPALYKQMEEIFKIDSYDWNFALGRDSRNRHQFWRSENLNDRGEYYWLVFSRDTIINGYENGNNNTGRDEYAHYIPYEDYWLVDRVPDFKVYLFNVSFKTVELNLKYKLSTIERITPDTNHLQMIKDNTTIQTDYGTSDAKLRTGFDNKTYMSINGERLNNNYIKWNVELNLSEIKKRFSNDYNTRFYYILPKSQTPFITSNSVDGSFFFYDPNERIMRLASHFSSYLSPNALSYCNVPVNNNFGFPRCTSYTGFSSINSVNNSYYFDLINLWNLNKSDYNLYWGGMNSINYTGKDNGNATFSFITKILPGYEDKEYEELYFQMALFGNSVYTHTGRQTMGINYAAKGIVQNQKIEAEHSSTQYVENKIIDTWRVKDEVNTNDRNYYMSPRTRSLPINSHPPESALLNGVWQISAKHTDISAAFTKLKKINVHLNFYNMSTYSQEFTIDESQLTNLENKFCDGSICVNVNFLSDKCRGDAYNDISCLEENYGTNYLDKFKYMNHGFSLRIIGLENVVSVYVDYLTETNIQDVRDSINGGGSNVLLYLKDYTVTSKITKSDWYSDDPYYRKESSTNYVTDIAEANNKILADLAIEKETSEVEKKKYRTRDTTENVLKVTIGFSETDSVDIKDIMLGFDQYGLERSDKLADTISTKDALLQLKKYLRVEKLKIKYYKDIFDKLHNEELPDIYDVVYQNGAFADNWKIHSTYSINSIENDLFSLHLQPNEGRILSSSRFVIEYDLVFDIDNVSKAVDDAGNILQTFRDSEYYAGGHVELISTAEASRSYAMSVVNTEPINSVDLGTDLMEHYVSHVDAEKGKLYCYPGDKIKSGYLEIPLWEKQLHEELAEKGTSSWNIVGHLRSTGKDSKALFSIRDIYTYSSDDSSPKIDELNKLLLKHSKIRNLRVNYKENEYTSNEYIELYKHEQYLKENDEFQTENGIHGTFTVDTENGINLITSIENLEYDGLIKISYDVDVDYETFYQEALSKNLIDNEMKVGGTDIIYNVAIKNTVLGFRENELLTDKSSGYINVTDVIPAIKKELTNQTDHTSNWNLTFNTGYSRKQINLSDKVAVEGNEIIKKSMVIDNIVVKVNNDVVYNNGDYADNWEDNLTIDVKNMNLNITLNESIEDPYIARNSNVVVTYSTHIDENIYSALGGEKNGEFSVSNVVTLSKNDISSTAEAKTKKINFNFPLTFKKTSKGTVEDKLHASRWNINVNSGSLKRTNLVITDSALASDDYTKYLKLTDLTVTKIDSSGSNIIFDYKNNINNLEEDYVLLDKDGEPLVFNRIGFPDFIMKIGTLEKGTILSIDYILEIDTEKYEYDKKASDVKIEINNKATLESEDTTLESSVKGYAKVLSNFKKSYSTLQGSSLYWNIDLNLLVDYKDVLTDETDVVVEDELDDLLQYCDNSLEVWSMHSTVSNRVLDKKLTKDVDYIFTFENNTVKIKILKPLTNNCLQIKFKTNVLSSTNNLKNYLKVGVENQFKYINSDSISHVDSGLTSGMVNSKEYSYYTIHANKYLDESLTNKKFKFKMEEIDFEGNVIDETQTVIVNNKEDGSIDFTPIELVEEGVRYYRIQEISEEDENYNYDSNKYILKLTIAEYKGEYIVEECKIINSDVNEINFYNTTKKSNIENPYTNSTNLISLLIMGIMVCGGIAILKNKQSKKV